MISIVEGAEDGAQIQSDKVAAWPCGSAFGGELLSVLGGQFLPAAELRRVTTGDAADGSSAEKAIQNIETNVPARGAPRDEAAVDVVPQRQARAATDGFEFPPDIAVLQHLRRVGARHCCGARRGRSQPGESHTSNR